MIAKFNRHVCSATDLCKCALMNNIDVMLSFYHMMWGVL
jgi:hypothetical protein